MIHAGEQNNTLGARDLHTRKTPLVPRVGNKESSTVHPLYIHITVFLTTQTTNQVSSESLKSVSEVSVLYVTD